jgi:adenylate kinase
MIVFGPPGVGKSIQADMLRHTLEVCPLSTGEIFRAACDLPDSQLSPPLREALVYVRRGELAPDDIVMAMIRERITCLNCRYGFLLDGFPRTVAQAEGLESIMHSDRISLDAVIQYESPIELTISRLSGRRFCRSCNAQFHIENKPSTVEGICDVCGGTLYQLEEDSPEMIRVRVEEFERSTAPLAAYYSKKGLLLTVSAVGTPEEVYERTLKLLEDQIVKAAATAERAMA